MDWSLLVSVVALVFSLLTWLVSWARSRKRVEIIVDGYTGIPLDSGEQLIFSTVLENRSSLPIAVSYVCVMQDGRELRCSIPSLLLLKQTSRKGSEITSETETRSLPFPINLPPLGSAHGYLYLPPPSQELDFSKPQIFRLYTNRGMVEKKICGLAAAHLDKTQFFP